MRVVICADAHLDSVFSVFRKNPGKTQIRREEQKLAFAKAIDEAKRTDAHMLILPGDLLDARNATRETIDFLISAFQSIPDTFVLISPGNHDPATSDSPYLTIDWPENVYIFRKGLEALELSYEDTGETVRVYGAGFQGHFNRNSLLRHNNTLPILDKNNINLLVMHGNLMENGGKSDYNPIYREDLNACGFDFCALGHVHKYSGVIKCEHTAYAYTGPCEGRGFDETETCGILSGTITKGAAELNFIPTSVRENHVVRIDITALGSYEQVLNAIRSKCTTPEYLYKIILTGRKQPHLHLSVAKLTSELSSDYFYAKVFAEYQEGVDTELLKNENSLRGCFVRCMLEQMAGAEDKDKMQEALYYGLQAFDGEVLFNDNP